MSFEGLAELILDPGLPPLLVYAIVFLSCILESFFPPWPTDVIAVYAGFLAGRGLLAPGIVFVVAILGTQVGAIGAFWVGRRWGRRLLTGAMGQYLPTGRLGQLEAWFARYGVPAIAVSRFFPGIRALVMPAAGLARFTPWKVMVFAGISVILWNVFVVGMGLLAGAHLDRAKHVLVQYNVVAMAVLVIVGTGFALVVLYRRYVSR